MKSAIFEVKVYWSLYAKIELRLLIRRFNSVNSFSLWKYDSTYRKAKHTCLAITIVMMVFAIECPIPFTLKMVEKQENPEKIGDSRSHLSSGVPCKISIIKNPKYFLG